MSLPPFSKDELTLLRGKAGTGYIPTLEEVARFVRTIRQSFSALPPAKGKSGKTKPSPSTKDEDIDFF